MDWGAIGGWFPWGPIGTWFADTWVDLGTFIVAVAYAGRRCYRTTEQSFISRQTGFDILHGVAIFPLLLLTLSFASAAALEALLHSHKIILGVAGAVALLAILEERPAVPK